MSMIEGTLEDGELLPTLRWIAALRQGGLLSVQGEPDLVSVTFEAGEVVAADAMNRPAEEMLGEVLARRGLLDPAAYAEAVEPFMGTGRLASEVLAERGLVGREELLDAVREQTYAQVLRLLRWDSGNFHWTPKVESPFEAGMRPISVAELLLQSSADLGAEGPLRGDPPDLEQTFRLDPSPRARSIRVLGREEGWEPSSGDALWLTPAEHRILVALEDGPRTGARLAIDVELEPVEIRYALHELRRAGLLQSVAVDAGPVISDAATTSLAQGGVAPDDLLAPQLPGDAERSAADWSVLAFPESPPAEPVPAFSLDALSFDATPIREESTAPPVAPDPAWSAERVEQEPFDAVLPFEPWKRVDREPETVAAPERPKRRPRRGLALQQSATWLARSLALGLVILVLLLVVWPGHRSSLFFPFPWQLPWKGGFEQRQARAIYDKIDRAVRTYYLLYGRYPEELGILVDLELLRERELFDPRGRWLQYDLADGGFTLRPVESGSGGPPAGVRADLRSDFFLNPKFVELPESRSNPVLLLD